MSDESTRSRVLAAAVACVLELGYYRATSNAIARRAGVTWGVIQHHFGTREALMLAVLEDRADRFEEVLATVGLARPDGDALAGYLEAMMACYSDPIYLVQLQIVLNLSHDPDVSAATAETRMAIDERLGARMTQRLAAALGADPDPVLVATVFDACRGFALSRLVSAATGGHRHRPLARADASESELLVRALAGLVAEGRAPSGEHVEGGPAGA